MENERISFVETARSIASKALSFFKGGWVRSSLMLSGAVIVLIGGLVLWNKVLSPDARKSRSDAQKVAEFVNNIELAKESRR